MQLHACSILVATAACSASPSEGEAVTAIRAALTRGKPPTRLVGAFNTVDVPFEIDRIDIRSIGESVSISTTNEDYYPVRASVTYRFEDGLPGRRAMRTNVHDGDYQLWRSGGTWMAAFWSWSVKPSYTSALGPPHGTVHNALQR